VIFKPAIAWVAVFKLFIKKIDFLQKRKKKIGGGKILTKDFSKELVLITDLGLEKFLIGSTIDELP
jgi:hypothetical protein